MRKQHRTAFLGGLRAVWAALVFLAAGGSATMAAPATPQDVILRYNGRLRVDGVPYTGNGAFMFLIEGASGEIVWASGDFPFAGSTNSPKGALGLPVRDGTYSVRLGQSGSGMPPLDLAGLLRVSHPRLKIWFDDHRQGWQRAGDAVPLDPLLASLAGKGQGSISGTQTDAILRELQEVRGLLSKQNRPAAPPAPTVAKVGVAGPAQGKQDAPVVMVEFTDYQCPFCRKFHETVLPDLVRKYVETGKLRVVSRNLALPFHPNAEPAALAALCANAQDQYWPMRQKLFDTSTTLSAANIAAAAASLSMNQAEFAACVDAKKFLEAVKRDGRDAGAVGISGTPTFVIGKAGGDEVNGTVIVGVQPLAVFEAEIRKLLPAP